MSCSILVAVACLPAVALGPGLWGFARRVPTLGAVGRQNAGYRAGLLDAAGRKVLNLHSGENDVSHLTPGVYFVHGTHRSVIQK